MESITLKDGTYHLLILSWVFVILFIPINEESSTPCKVSQKIKETPSVMPPGCVGGAPYAKTTQRPVVSKDSPTLRSIFSEDSGLSPSGREDLVIEWTVRLLKKVKEGYASDPPTFCKDLTLDTVSLRDGEVLLKTAPLSKNDAPTFQGDNLRSLAVLIYEAYTGEKLANYDQLRGCRRHLPEKLKKCIEKCAYATVDEVLKDLDSPIDKLSKPRSKSKPSGSKRQYGSNHVSSHEISTLPPTVPSFPSPIDVNAALVAASACCPAVEPSVFGPTDLPPTKELSILLIGESGVGKSTLVNTFSLCSQFSRLPTIPLENTRWPIPVRFVFDGVEISTGEKEAEALGGSVTQAPQDYYFNYTLNGLPVRVCVIDTPGMGDTRGLEKDAENIRNIIRHLSHHKTLYGVCFLLKPNDSRFTVFLKYCIEELLKHFHRSILDNIVIGFTHTRATLYKPGDTLPSLMKYFTDSGIRLPLEKKILYCFDSEIVRLLAICSQNANLITNEMCSASAESWHRMRGELARMFGHIAGLHPHHVQETVSFDVTLRVSEALVYTLPGLRDGLETKRKDMEEERGYLRALYSKEKSLQDKARVKKYIYEDRDLDHPGLRCKGCYQICCSSPIPMSRYKAMEKSKQEKLEDNLLAKVTYSWSFIRPYGNCCKRCFCLLANHELALTKRSFCSRLVENPEVKKELEACKDDEQRVEKILEESQKIIDSYTQACTTVGEALEIFKQFLAENSILDLKQQAKNLEHRSAEISNYIDYGHTDSKAKTLIRKSMGYFESMVTPGGRYSVSKLSVEEVQR